MTHIKTQFTEIANKWEMGSLVISEEGYRVLPGEFETIRTNHFFCAYKQRVTNSLGPSWAARQSWHFPAFPRWCAPYWCWFGGLRLSFSTRLDGWLWKCRPDSPTWWLLLSLIPYLFVNHLLNLQQSIIFKEFLPNSSWRIVPSQCNNSSILNPALPLSHF